MTSKEFLKQCGLPANFNGYHYAAYLIDYISDNYQDNLTKIPNIVSVLYPMCADKFETTPANVERCIRHLIEHMYDSTVNDFIQKVFKNVLLTNKSFIMTAVDYIIDNK